MSRFFGEVGYGTPVEDPPGSGKWVDQITERFYYGDILRIDRNLGSDDKINEDVLITNRISIVPDQLANENFLMIKYVRWSGVLWVVTSVTVQAPRLILSLGKVYNGPTPSD